MTQARIEHTFNCSPETFWDKIFFDEEYNQRLFVEALRFESWNVARFEDSGDRIVRVVDATPKIDVPAALKKFAEKGLGYRETSIFDKQTRVLKNTVEPESLKGKLSVGGEIRAEPAGERRCRRIFDLSVEAKVFGVGGMIEKRIISDIQDNYEKAAVFTNAFIAEKGL
jgi:hypothetical protein